MSSSGMEASATGYSSAMATMTFDEILEGLLLIFLCPPR